MTIKAGTALPKPVINQRVPKSLVTKPRKRIKSKPKSLTGRQEIRRARDRDSFVRNASDRQPGKDARARNVQGRDVFESGSSKPVPR